MKYSNKGLIVFKGNTQGINGRSKHEDNQNTSRTGFKGTNHSSKEMDLKMMNELVSVSHVTSKRSLPGSHRGEIPHFYTRTRGTPTSTASTRTTKALEEQSSLALWGTTTWLTGVGRSQGSITDTLFGPSVAPIGELRQSHTWTVTGTIWLQAWHQYGIW